MVVVTARDFKKAKDHQLNTIIFGEIKDALLEKVDEIGFLKKCIFSGVRVEIRVIDVEAEVEIGKSI